VSANLVDTAILAARERKRTLETTLLLNAAGTFALLMIAWYFRLIDADISRIALPFAIYSAMHVAFASITDRFGHARALTHATTVSELASVGFLAFAWHLAGGVVNPMFLIAMILPVAVASVLQLRTLAVATAAWSVCGAGVVAIVESPELRWFIERLGIKVPLSGSIAAHPLFPGIETTPSALVVALSFFAIVQFGVAIVGIVAGRKVVSLALRFSTPGERIASVAHGAIAESPSPLLVVYKDTGQVHVASRSFMKQMLLRQPDLHGRTVFDLLRFDDEESVRAALTSGAKMIPIRYNVGREARDAELAIHSFIADGQSFAAMRFDEHGAQA
jgi:hypothetical protein